MKLAIAIVVGVIVVALASCSGPPEAIDVDALERDVLAQLVDEVSPEVESVECPATPLPEVAAEIECTVRIAGQQTPAVVRLQRVDLDDEVQVTATAALPARLVDSAEMERLVAERFELDLGIATGVDCGRDVVVLPVEEGVVCTATDAAGIERRFALSLDADGTIGVAIL